MPAQFDIPIRQTLTFTKGDSFAWPLTFRRTTDGQPVDLGPAPRMQIRDKPEGTLIRDVSEFWTNPSPGDYDFLLPPEVTSALPTQPGGGASWVYDLKFDDTVNGFGTKTWFSGPVVIKPRVTQP